MRKYELIMMDIKNEINSGILKPSQKIPTEKELCAKYETSMITVVKALNELKNQGFIVRARGSGSYVKDQLQPKLNDGKRLSLAVLWHSHLTSESFFFSFFGYISQGILDCAGLKKEHLQWQQQEGNSNLVASIQSNDRSVSIDFISESLSSQTRVPILEEVLKKNYNSYITMGIKSEMWLDSLLNTKIPTVIIDQLSDRYNYLADQVFIDPHPAFHQLLDFFISKKISKIHFVIGYTSIPAPDSKMNLEAVAKFRNRMMMEDPDSVYRCKTFKRIAEDKGLIFEDKWIHSYQPLEFTYEEIAAKILQLPEKERPQAIICPSIGIAETFMNFFYQRGVKIICAGITNAKYNGPAIPIRVHCENLGLVGFELLLSKMQRPNRMAIRAGVPMEVLLQESSVVR